MSWQGVLWATSANTLWAVWLNGHNVRLSWKVSLANQALWLVFIVAFGVWGLLPLTLSLAAVFARHLTRSPKRVPAPGNVPASRPVSPKALRCQSLARRMTAAGAVGGLDGWRVKRLAGAVRAVSSIVAP